MDTEEKICTAFQKHFNGVEVPVMDIPRIYAAVETKYVKTGESIDNIVSDLAYQYKMMNEMQEAARCL